MLVFRIVIVTSTYCFCATNPTLTHTLRVSVLIQVVKAHFRLRRARIYKQVNEWCKLDDKCAPLARPLLELMAKL